MAVKPELIRVAVRKLFPQANLSTKRMDEISARLAKKPKDDATEAEIEEVVTDYNENGAMTFEEIAKADDKIRTLEAKPKDAPKEEAKKEEVKNDPDEPAWFKAYRESNESRLAKMEQDKTKETISSKFANDERVKNIPAFMRKGFIPTSEDDYESNVEALVAEFKPFVEQHKLAGFDGSDTPSSSTSGGEAAKGKVKEISIEDARKIVS